MRNGAFLSGAHARWLCLSCLVGLLALAGCGSGIGKLVPVEGKVLVGGQPLTVGEVRYHPDPPKPSVRMEIVGKIGADGKYSLTTNSKPGAPHGKYKVTVQTITPGGATTGDPIGAAAPVAVGPAQRQANEKYEAVTSTPLSMTIPGSNYDLSLDR